MNWLENNPVGMALASVCGVLLLVAAVLVFVWSRPAPTGADARDVEAPAFSQPADLAMDLGPISDYLPNREWDRSVFLRFSLDH